MWLFATRVYDVMLPFIDSITCFLTGWRPRRTIKLCSWSAEEQGLIGSTEWVEEQSKIVRDRVVAYINIDAVVRGNHSLEAKGSPLLKQLMYEEGRKVLDPRNDGLSLYDWWKNTSAASSKYPAYKALGSGSDFVPFYQFLGKIYCSCCCYSVTMETLFNHRRSIST